MGHFKHKKSRKKKKCDGASSSSSLTLNDCQLIATLISQLFTLSSGVFEENSQMSYNFTA